MIDRLFHDGLFYRLERRAHIFRGEKEDLRRHTSFLLAVGWFPLIVLSIGERLVTGEPMDLLRLPEVHLRWLLGVPALFLGERWMDHRIQQALAYLEELGIVPEHERAKLESTEHTVAQWSRSWVLELLLLAGAVSLSFPALASPQPASAVWLLAVSLPIYRYLLCRFLLRWCLWCFLLLRLSTFDLHLVATHPDRVGGLGVLGEASLGMGPIAFGIGMAGTSRWASQIAMGQATPGEFIYPAATFVLVFLALACAPLLPFMRILRRTKFRFIHEYAAFADRYAELFHAKWISRPSPDPLGTADIQSFADLANVFGVVMQTRLIIFTKSSILYLVICCLLPLVPVVLITIPLEQLLLRVASMVL